MTEKKIQTDEIELTKKLFEVKGENGTQLMAIHDVVYLEANGSYTKLTASTAEW